MIESAARLKKKLGFFYAQLGLVTGKDRITEKVSSRLGTPVRLRPFLKGRGWGLKYLVFPAGACEPTHLVKAASRIIERRVARDKVIRYYPHPERFAREAEILGALAEIGLGPSILMCEADFFVREYLPGCPLSELGQEDLEAWLPRVLEALEEICEAGILHTDPNAENVIVDRQNRRLFFIDSEISISEPALGTVSPEHRLFCHERLLATLSRRPRESPAAGKPFDERLPSLVREFYTHRKSPGLSPERAVALLQGETAQRNIPS